MIECANVQCCWPEGSPQCQIFCFGVGSIKKRKKEYSREKMGEIMFDTFKVPAINVAIPARLLLFVRVAEVVRRHKVPLLKSLDSDENFKH